MVIIIVISSVPLILDSHKLAVSIADSASFWNCITSLSWTVCPVMAWLLTQVAPVSVAAFCPPAAIAIEGVEVSANWRPVIESLRRFLDCWGSICWRGSLSWLNHAVFSAVIDGLAHLAPACCWFCHVAEALWINTGVYFRPVHSWCIGCFDSEVLVIDHPRWPLEFNACLCNVEHVGHQPLSSFGWVCNDYGCIYGKALDPCSKVWHQPLCLHQLRGFDPQG